MVKQWVSRESRPSLGKTHPVPRPGPPVQRHGLVKVFFVGLTLEGEDRVGELFALGRAVRTLAAMLMGWSIIPKKSQCARADD